MTMMQSNVHTPKGCIHCNTVTHVHVLAHTHTHRGKEPREEHTAHSSPQPTIGLTAMDNWEVPEGTRGGPWVGSGLRPGMEDWGLQGAEQTLAVTGQGLALSHHYSQPLSGCTPLFPECKRHAGGVPKKWTVKGFKDHQYLIPLFSRFRNRQGEQRKRAEVLGASREGGREAKMENITILNPKRGGHSGAYAEKR